MNIIKYILISIAGVLFVSSLFFTFPVSNYMLLGGWISYLFSLVLHYYQDKPFRKLYDL